MTLTIPPPGETRAPPERRSRVPAPAGVTIRPAIADDASVVAAIHDEGIRGRGATFEVTERTPADALAWFAPPIAEAPPHPFVVAIGADGAVLGWARASLAQCISVTR